MARKRSRDTGRDNSRQNEPRLSHYQSHQRKPVRRSVHATTGRESWNNCPSIGRHLHRLLATALRLLSMPISVPRSDPSLIMKRG